MSHSHRKTHSKIHSKIYWPSKGQWWQPWCQGLQPPRFPQQEPWHWNSAGNTNPGHIFNTQGRHWKCQHRLCLWEIRRLQNKTIRISAPSTVNQVQDQQKYRDILLILNDWNEWRTWNSLERGALSGHTCLIYEAVQVMVHSVSIYWEEDLKIQSSSLCCNHCRGGYNENEQCMFQRKLKFALVYQYFLLQTNNHIFLHNKTGLLYEMVQLSTGQYFYSSYFKYFSCPFFTSHYWWCHFTESKWIF